MRQIHPVTVHERFVASGVYTHYTNDRPSGLVEYWSIHELPDSAQLIRVDIDGRKQNRRSRLIEAWRSPAEAGGKIERYDIQAYQDGDEPIKQVQASYALYEDHVEVGRTLNNEPRIYEELPVNRPCMLVPHGLLFLGFYIAAVGNASQNKNLQFVTNRDFFFEAYDLAFRATILAPDVTLFRDEKSFEIGGITYAARHYLLDNDDDVWIDQHGTAILYEETVSHFTRLTEYARRPEPKAR